MGGIFRQYSWIFNLVAIFAASFFLAKIVGVYLGGKLEVTRSVGILSESPAALPPPSRVTMDDYKIILERNIFDSTERAAEASTEEEREAGVAAGEAVPTSLSITVLGVLVVGDGRDRRSSATVASSGKDEVYSVGDVESFAPNTKLVLVAPDRIEFLHGGRLEYAEVGEDVGGSIFGPPLQEGGEVVADAGSETKEAHAVAQDAPGKYVIDQTEVDNALQNLDQLYTEIRAVPNFADGKVSGMKILSVKNDSLFAKLGLKRGDILQRINGLELDVKQGFQIFSQLRDAKELTLDLIRHGQPQTLEYEIR